MHERRLRIDELKALSEAALSEELSFQVPADSNLSTRLFELLFNYGLLGLTS